jgi:hypothetical protein
MGIITYLIVVTYNHTQFGSVPHSRGYLGICDESGYGIIRIASFSTPSGTHYYYSVRYLYGISQDIDSTHTQRERGGEGEVRESENEKDRIISPLPPFTFPFPFPVSYSSSP